MTSRSAVVAALALWAPVLHAQIGLASTGTTVALSATKATSVSVSLPGGSSASLPGALVSTVGAIPSSAVLGRVPTGGPKAFLPFVGAPVSAGSAVAGTAGGTLVLFTQPISDANA